MILGQDCVWLSDAALNNFFLFKKIFIEGSVNMLWTKCLFKSEVPFYSFLLGKNAFFCLSLMLPSISKLAPGGVFNFSNISESIAISFDLFIMYAHESLLLWFQCTWRRSVSSCFRSTFNTNKELDDYH